MSALLSTKRPRDRFGQPIGSVYLIRDGDFVKIGFATNIENRLAELRCGNPRALLLVGTIKGTRSDEASLHRKFEAFRYQVEWFVPDEWMWDELRRLFGDDV